MATNPSTPATLKELIGEDSTSATSPVHTHEAPSTRSGHPPGTPKPPFDPPRRRSSLHFSRISCSPADALDDSSVDLPASPHTIADAKSNPSAISRRRMPLPVTANVTPGHVAQMQRLFQSAKASLQMDMAFAASPTGSIGSRLPPSLDSASADSPTASDDIPISAKAWRYSTAPGILLGYDRDVREPVPGASPPSPLTAGEDPHVQSANEPISSGFNTPMFPEPAFTEDGQGIDPSSSPPTMPQPPIVMSELQDQLTGLRVGSDQLQHQDRMEMDESPLVARLRRLSADIQPTINISEDSIMSEPSDGEIFLSEPAEAAAASAKERRGILRNLFHLHRSSRERLSQTPQAQDDPKEEPEPEQAHTETRIDTPCPDPQLHEIFARTNCPDPMAHLTAHVHNHMAPADPLSTGSHISVNLEDSSAAIYGTLQPPMPPYSRASSTGSPMAIPRFKSPPASPRRMSEQYHQQSYLDHRPVRQIRTQPSIQRETSEHFQPGWYYTQSKSKSSARNRNEYSFSTAAGRVTGRSAAPDSLIRDSYRTDTLTPLARPMGKYRKTGIAAMASSRGVSKYYGDFGGRTRSDAPTASGTRRPQNRAGVHFRSSPPPQARNMVVDAQKRPRPRDLEDDFSHDDDSQALELDDDTRAAIRLSLLASETPETQRVQRALRELSPNVMTARGPDRRQRKKRRPSYWDGDLKEIQDSPARRDGNGNMIRESVRAGAERRVLTSPPKDGVESVRSERVEIEVGNYESIEGDVESTIEHHNVKEQAEGDVDGTMMQIEREID